VDTEIKEVLLRPFSQTTPSSISFPFFNILSISLTLCHTHTNKTYTGLYSRHVLLHFPLISYINNSNLHQLCNLHSFSSITERGHIALSLSPYYITRHGGGGGWKRGMDDGPCPRGNFSVLSSRAYTCEKSVCVCVCVDKQYKADV